VFNNVVSQNFFTLIIFLLTIYQNHKKKKFETIFLKQIYKTTIQPQH
jgi:hypothetical protein